MEVLRMYGRAEEVLREFSGFCCLRLVLDKQSPLATYFMDFFCQMFWIMHELIESPTLPTHSTPKKPSGLKDSQVWDVKKELLSSPSWSRERKKLIWSVLRLRLSLAPVVYTCFDLYAACQLSPTCFDLYGSGSKWLHEGELRREPRVGRMFSENELHCRMRSVGFVNLDGYCGEKYATKVRLGEELGVGACGTVYKSYFEKGDVLGEKQIGCPVAVKMFGGAGGSSSSNATIQSGRAWYTRMEHIMRQADIPARLDPRDEELRRMVSLRHPNIVSAKGYIGKRGHLGESGLVMELMDRSLHDVLEKVKDGEEAPLDELQMIDVMLEIARGMRFLHECGLMHRDLKPGNVLLRRSVTRADSNGNSDESFEFAEVKLADFGITKDILSQHDELHTAPAGTNYYMAPEVQRSSGTSGTAPYTDKADVFSYGTTCFNILIGDPRPDAYLQTSETGSKRREQFYTAVERGEWKEWVQQLQHDWPILVGLIERCWQTEPRSRPTFASICLLLDVVKQSQLSRAPFHLLFSSDRFFPFLLGSVLLDRLRGIPTGKELIRTVLQEFERDSVWKDGKKLLRKWKKLEAVLKPANLASRVFLLNSVWKGIPAGTSLLTLPKKSFDFASDGAFTELDEDPSMIPLFVCFSLLSGPV